MTPTTQRILREAFATAIAAIEPTDENHPTFRWHRVRGVKEVPGGVRTFLVRFLPGAAVEDGLFGDGWEQIAECQIYASYGDLGDDDDGPTIDEDGRQLYCTLVDLIDPQTDGLCPVVYLGWDYEEDQPGKVWGCHKFNVRYLVADQANP